MIGIYKYVDAETKEVVYVGKSNNLKKRLFEHVYFGDISKWFAENNYEVYVIETSNRADADILETAFINYYMPKYNKFKMYGVAQTLIDLKPFFEKWEICEIGLINNRGKRNYKKKIEIPMENVKKYLESLKGQKLYRNQIDALKKQFADFGFKDRTFGIKTINKICSENRIPLTVESYRNKCRGSEHRDENYWIIEEAHRNIA